MIDYSLVVKKWEAGFAVEGAASVTRLKRILEYNVHRAVNWVDKPSEAAALGQLVHCCVLEPAEVTKRYYPMPAVDGRTKAGKAAKEDAEREAGDRQLVSIDLLAKAQLMAASVAYHPVAGHWLEMPGWNELKVGWYDPFSQTHGKGILDRLSIQGSMIVDLKTTRCAGLEAFQKECGNYKYHVQAAYYLDGVNLLLESTGAPPVEDFAFIAVETDPPYEVGAYLFEDSAIQRGRLAYRQALKEWRAHLDNPDAWCGYPLGVRIGIPRWA